jgi:hypothetical protein
MSAQPGAQTIGCSTEAGHGWTRRPSHSRSDRCRVFVVQCHGCIPSMMMRRSGQGLTGACPDIDLGDSLSHAVFSVDEFASNIELQAPPRSQARTMRPVGEGAVPTSGDARAKILSCTPMKRETPYAVLRRRLAFLRAPSTAGLSADKLLRLVASLVQGSEHPLAEASVSAARKRGRSTAP